MAELQAIQTRPYLNAMSAEQRTLAHLHWALFRAICERPDMVRALWYDAGAPDRFLALLERELAPEAQRRLAQARRNYCEETRGH